MRDHLIQVTSLAAAKTKLAAYLKKDEKNRDVFRLPQWCDILPVDAYSDMGTYDIEGNHLTPPILAGGTWFIVSFDKRNIPAGIKSVVMAEAAREKGLTLPQGIVGLSTIWAGMTIHLA